MPEDASKEKDEQEHGASDQELRHFLEMGDYNVFFHPHIDQGAIRGGDEGAKIGVPEEEEFQHLSFLAPFHFFSPP
jgi:hypothetical protein